MKRLRVTGTPDLDPMPEVFSLLAADSTYASEARLIEWNLASAERATVLFDVDGDADRFRAELADAPEVVAADVREIDDARFYLLLSLRPGATPMMREAFETLTRAGLVVLKPVVYREGQVHASLVGEPAALQTVVDDLPPTGEMTVHEVGEYGGGAEAGAVALSDRQREAVRAALDLGYYDVPRRATHGDVAERLGCAPSTASEHLQKAEAKLVRAAMEPAVGPER